MTRLLADGGKNPLVVIDQEDGSEKVISDTVASINRAALSPDGKWVASVAYQGETVDIVRL